MACPKCNHTMQGLCGDGEGRWFWCPACGTVKQGQQTEYYDVPTFIRSTSLVAYLHTNVDLCLVLNAIREELNRRGVGDPREPLDDPMGKG